MAIFKKGDHIEAISLGKGFEKAIVLKVYTSKHGKFCGQEMYLLQIVNGTATVPVKNENNYRLCKIQNNKHKKSNYGTR